MFPFSIARSLPPEPAPKPIEVGGIAGRAPQLRESAELLVKTIVKSLQTMAGSSTTIEGKLAGQTLRTPEDVLASPRADTVMGSIVLQDISCMLLVMLDSTLVHAVVELLCGGNGVEPQPTEARATTSIDQQFAQIIVTLAAAAMQTDWAERGFASTKAVKLEGFLTPDIFGPRVDEVGVFDVTLGIFGLHGTLRFIMPPAALDCFGETSPLRFDEPGSDPAWAENLKQQLEGTPVVLSAYFDGKPLPLSILADLQIGQVLPLPQEARSRAALAANGSVLFRGEIGRDESAYSVRIEDVVLEPSSFKAQPRPFFFEQSKD